MNLILILLGFVIFEVQSQKHDPTIYVTPVSINKSTKPTKPDDNEEINNILLKKKRNISKYIKIDTEPAILVVPLRDGKIPAKRNVQLSTDRNQRDSSPSIIYETPIKDFQPYSYQPPSTSYGVPFKYIPIPPSPLPSPTTEAINPPASPSNSYGIPIQSNPVLATTQEIATEKSETVNNKIVGQKYLPPPQEEETVRNIYFYKSGPDFEESVNTVRPINIPPSRKKVNVIFIKAPTFAAPSQFIPVIPQSEEKTLVYVLSKKPETPDIVIPTPPPQKQVQPEVYFIKYGVQRESDEQNGYVYDSPSEKSNDEKNSGSDSDGSDEKTRKKKRHSVVRKSRSNEIDNSFANFNLHYQYISQRGGALEK